MRGLCGLLAVILLMMCLLTACGANAPIQEQASPTLGPPAPVTVSSLPEDTPVPETLVLPTPPAGWAASYQQFLEDNFDLFSALWPDGISGMGFIDLDLDGTPELVVFDQGASASMGVQLFDLVDGKVCCVSSTLDSAGGAFDGTYLAPVHVCANFFESFLLSRTENGWCFWVNSENGTMETTWNEIVRFDGVNGVLTPASVCYRYTEFDPSSGGVVAEEYAVGGAAADQAAYDAAAGVYQEGLDAGYEARGVFRWGSAEEYDTTTYDGFLALVQAAVRAYVPITDTVTLSSAAN